MSSTRTSRAQRTQAAQRAAEIRRRAEVKEQRRHNGLVTGAVLTVLALLVGLGYAIQSSRDTTGQVADVPAGVEGTYGVPLGDAKAPVTVTIYEDFLCPFCGDLEAALASWLPEYVEDGTVRVVYQPLAFLDRYSQGTDYSTRTVSAYGAVLDVAGPDIASRFHDLLFENQPAENTPGLSDDELVSLAVRAGADEDLIRPLIEGRVFEQWSDNGRDAASKERVTSTPTVEVNGERLPPMAIDQLVARIRTSVEAVATP
ncbi:MAG TPA: thioredoxin domain-containing protein [Nocardioidaceae bacterium]|nr:thioredoxin domain-containing protein [Nocardioidaceae bacterium]